MDAVNLLLSNYSVEGIVLFIAIFVIATHTVGKGFEWIWGKLKSKFNFKTDSDKLEEILSHLQSVDERLQTTDNRLKNIQNRLLQDAKAYIFDKHHYYCYKVGCIDDMTMQLLEMRFTFYKSSGGNSYVESLMAELRALPRVAAENINDFEEV